MPDPVLAQREHGHVGRVARLELAGVAVEHGVPSPSPSPQAMQGLARAPLRAKTAEGRSGRRRC